MERIDDDAAGLVEPRNRALRFQIEMLLAADGELAAELDAGCAAIAPAASPRRMRSGPE